MKSNLKFSVLTILLVTFSSVGVFAQGRPPVNRAQSRPTTSRPASRGPVAVVDISHIFQNFGGFKAQMEKMKQEVQAYESQLKARHEALAKERETLNQYKPGSPNYKQLEQRLADTFAKLQVDTQLKKKEFLENEAKVYYQTYMHVNKAIASYAARNNIGLVLRFSREEMNQQDRNSVLAGVNRAVVFHQGSLDITTDILSEISRAPARVSRPSTSNGRREERR